MIALGFRSGLVLIAEEDIAIENPLLVSIALFCVSLLWCFLHRAVVDGFILNLE